MNDNNTGVLEAEEIPLEEVIDKTLVKANITEKVLAELQERHGNVRLKNIDDKESYLECKTASKEIRKVEILAEKICEHGRADAIKTQRLWLSKQKDLLEKTAKIKDPIDADIKRFEDEQERKEIEEKKRREGVFIDRQAQLFKMDAKYMDSCMVLRHISYEVELLRQADDDMWNDTILPKYKKVFEEVEAIKVQEESKRKEELELQKKEREEFEAKQKEFAKQQEIFAQQQADLQKQQDEANRKERLAQEQKDSQERQQKQQVIQSRTTQLRDLGMEYDYVLKIYSLGIARVDYDKEILELNNEEWNLLIQKITPIIQEELKESQHRIAEELKKEKQRAIQQAIEDDKIKQQQEQLRKQQEMEAAKDKEKYASVVEYLKHYPNFIMSSNIYKGKMNIINDFISEL